jgi:hypothetical protein
VGADAWSPLPTPIAIGHGQAVHPPVIANVPVQLTLVMDCSESVRAVAHVTQRYTKQASAHTEIYETRVMYVFLSSSFVEHGP